MQKTPVQFLGWEDLLEKALGYPILYSWDSLVAQTVKNLPEMWKTWVQSLGWGDSSRGGHGNALQYSCLDNPHGQRSLVDYSPHGLKESDAIE